MPCACRKLGMRKAGVTSCVDGERMSFFLIKILTQGLVSRVVLAPVVAESYDPVLNKLSDHGLNIAEERLD